MKSMDSTNQIVNPAGDGPPIGQMRIFVYNNNKNCAYVVWIIESVDKDKQTLCARWYQNGRIGQMTWKIDDVWALPTANASWLVINPR